MVAVSSYTLKGCGFNLWSGLIPKLPVPSPVRAHMGGGHQSMSLSETNGSISSGEVYKKSDLGPQASPSTS